MALMEGSHSTRTPDSNVISKLEESSVGVKDTLYSFWHFYDFDRTG